MCSKKHLFILLTLSVLSVFGLKAQHYTISGFISDVSSGETLISASVFDNISAKGTVSNNFGHYSLTLPTGEVELNYHYVGYTPEQYKFTLSKDTIINIQLDASISLKEVTVLGKRNELGVQGSQMSAIEVPVEQIKNIPTLFGENDLIKALQLLPGVQSGTEGSAGLYVRGGGPDQNLMLLDGIPIYNINHLFGFFSAFNTDAIKNVTLYKGSFPARFGGRISSVVDVRIKDGDDKNYHGNINIGLISSKINLEGPIWKEKTTFNISARRTYIDILTQPIIRRSSIKETNSPTTAGYFFYDLNAKLTHKFNDKDKLFLSAYLGDDMVYTKYKTKNSETPEEKYNDWMKMNWNWGNAIVSTRWNHLVSNKLFMNTTAAYTRYRSNMEVGYESLFEKKNTNPPEKQIEEFKVGYRSGIEDYSVRMDFDYAPNSAHDVKFGTNYTYHTFRPDVSTLYLNSNSPMNPVKVDTVIGSNNTYTHETTTYFEDNITPFDWLKLNAGLHFSTFHVNSKNYLSLEPRIGLRILANEKLAFKAGYARMSQYIHLLSNNSISMPTDLWVPTTQNIEPMKSQQFAIGTFYNLNNIVDLSLEGYYKTMDNLIEYKDGASFMGSSSGWEEKVVTGCGWSYGLEFLAQRSFGNTTGWLGYTWSKTERLFDRPEQTLNQGKAFPTKYDRRHDLSVTVMHKFSEKIDISGNWVFATGNTATLGMQKYQTIHPPQLNNYNSDNALIYYSARNNYRYANYHRMDLSINFHKQKKHGIRTWNISIYNVYNQKNPFMVYESNEGYYDAKAKQYKSNNVLKQVTLFPIIPSVSYSFKF